MNKIRVIKKGFKNKFLIKFLDFIKVPNNIKYRMKDHNVNKNLNFSNKRPFVNLKVLDSVDVKGFTCIIPLKIWKILDEKTGLEHIKDYNDELIDNKRLFGIGTGENVFWSVGEYIYSRNASLDGEKLCKGSIKYNKEKNCAMLELKL